MLFDKEVSHSERLGFVMASADVVDLPLNQYVYLLMIINSADFR